MKDLGLKKLGKNIVSILTRQLVVGLIQLIIAAMIARQYGPEGNGSFSIAMLLPSMLTTFLNFGVGSANVFYLGSRQFSPRNVFKTSLKLGLIFSILGLIIGGTVIQFEGQKLFPGILPKMLILALFVFPISLIQTYISSIFQGIQKFREFNLILLLQSLMMLGIVCVLMIFELQSLYYLIGANLITTSITLVLSGWLLRKFIHEEERTSSLYASTALKYGYKAHLSNILAFINYKVDIFLVNLLIDPAAAGVYVISVKLGERLWVLSQAISTALLPRLSELTNDEKKRLHITPLVSRITFWVTLSSSVILGIVAYPLIIFVFGNEYLDSYFPLLVLLPGIVFMAVSRILANDLAARGRPELNMYTSWVVVVTNIIGNLLFIPAYGLQGAALATTIAYTLNFIMRLFMYKHITDVLILNLILIKLVDLRGLFEKFKKIST